MDDLLLRSTNEAALAQVRAIFADLPKGTIDRSLLSSNAGVCFTDEALADSRASSQPLGR